MNCLGTKMTRKRKPAIEGFEKPSKKCQTPQRRALNLHKNRGYSKRSIDDYVSAILERDKGVQYQTVLDRHNLTPNQLFRAVHRGIDSIILSSNGAAKKTLQAIAGNHHRSAELFNMGEDFLREQYD